MLQSADMAWHGGDHDQAVELLERAIRLAPADPKIPLQLAWINGLRYEYALAEQCFEKAIRVAPNKTAILSKVGQVAVDFANHKLAEKYLTQAAGQKDVTAETLVALAELYERLRRSKEAEDYL
jgi:tetratricopeptide (TPR) repeat protein